MKTVFNNRQLAHVWAQQTQTKGRNPSGSMFFDGDTIYSYGSHYPMAKIYYKNDKRLVLVKEEGYSQTTQKQRGYVLNALSHNGYLYVSDVTCFKSEQNENYLYNQVIEALDNGFNTRKQHFSFELLRYSIENLNIYLEFTDQKPFELPELYYETLKEINKIRIDKQLERDAFNKIKNARLAAEQEQARLARVEEYKHELVLWPQGLNTKFIPHDLFPKNYDMIRIKPSNPDTVETSRGAEVPLSHALRLLKLTLNKETKQGDRVGHFTVDEIKETTLKIGCHIISIDQAKEVLSSQLLTDKVG